MELRSALVGVAAGVTLGVILERTRRCYQGKATKGKSSRDVVQSGSDIFVDRSELESAVAACLKKAGACPPHADLVAEVLVAADRRGIPSHGVNRTEMYCGELRAGLIDPLGEPCVVSETSSTANIDGQNGLGAVTAKMAMELCIKKAKDAGVGLVVCHRSNHYGIAGYWADLALNHGLIAFSFTNTSPIVIPTRALQKSSGTNPIACYCPAASGDSFQLDMATSTVPLGKIEVCHRKGQKLPAGWGLDKTGAITTDPEEAMTGGGLTPLGGMEETAGYKGYGLNMMVEILCGVLSGCEKVGPDVPPWRVDRGTLVDYGHCFMCIDPEKLLPGGDFKGKLAAYLARMRALQPVNPDLQVLVPGDPERAEEASAKKNGVRLNEQVAAGVRNLARELGCDKGLPKAILELPESANAPKSLLCAQDPKNHKADSPVKVPPSPPSPSTPKTPLRTPKIPRPTALRVSIFKATGLVHLNRSGDNIYCHCEVLSKDGKHKAQPLEFETSVIKNTLSPEWNEFFDLPWHSDTDIYTTGLAFTIYDAGLLAKKTEGKVSVSKKQFLPHGYEGTLPIVGCQNGWLHVKIQPIY